MNEATHFFFGVFIAHFILNKEIDRFECFFLGLAALIPDVDSIIGFFIPYEHGVFTHTIVGGLLFTLIISSFVWIISRNFLKNQDITYLYLLFLATLGMFSHLLLDSFTFYDSYASDGTSHMYFWPFSNFPVHFNTIIPGITYEIRVLNEVLVSIALGVAFLFYGWAYKKDNPFLIFSPQHWNSYASQTEAIEKPKPPYAFMISAWVFIGGLILTYII